VGEQVTVVDELFEDQTLSNHCEADPGADGDHAEGGEVLPRLRGNGPSVVGQGLSATSH
jgi:hypothetical protein